MLELVLIILGLVGLWFGSDYAVEAARRIALKLGISELIIGLTITSIGTSLPEIFTNIMAGFQTRAGLDASGIAVGNIIGSNLAQITLLLGIVGFISVLSIPARSLRRDGIMLFFAILLMFVTVSDGYVTQFEGAFLVASYLIYLAFLLNQERITGKNEGVGRNYHIITDVFKTLIGLVAVIVSANLVVENGVSMAKEIGIDDAIIGLLVGLGTSIPELTVSLRAISKRAGHLSLGNLIGSNITDPLFSFGVGAMIAGVTVSSTVIRFDFPFWMASTAIALLLLYNHMDLNRKESSILIILYALFMYVRLTFFIA